MNVFGKLTRFVKTAFKTTIEIFYEALRLSPNAQGYVMGSITELLLKKKLEEEYGCEVKRIREKWEGRKHPHHRGDFYFRPPGRPEWYVIECKGVKSNSEKWHKLYNYDDLRKFLIKHVEEMEIPWVSKSPGASIEAQVEKWIENNLPKFRDEYAPKLYTYDEIQNYRPGRRLTSKSQDIDRLRQLSRADIDRLIEERINYVMTRLKVLETHFPVGTSDTGERTQATPRRDEFNIVAVDIVLRYHEHKFVFANPRNLEPSRDDPQHLQQNYIVGFVFLEEDGTEQLALSDDWSANFEDVLATLVPQDAVREEDMQIDERFAAFDEEQSST